MSEDNFLSSIKSSAEIISNQLSQHVLNSIITRHEVSDLAEVPPHMAELLFDELDFIENDLR